MKIIFNHISTFGLTEGKNPIVVHERIPDSLNSTGVLFIYL
jgi:myo-inositol-1-phosphate synthase